MDYKINKAFILLIFAFIFILFNVTKNNNVNRIFYSLYYYIVF